EKLTVGRYSWRNADLRLAAEPDAADRVERSLSALGDPRCTLAALTLTGHVNFVSRAAIDLVIERWSARLAHLRVVDSGLAVAAHLVDLARLEDGGIVGAVVRRLEERMATAEGDERAEAELALRHLWSLLARIPAT